MIFLVKSNLMTIDRFWAITRELRLVEFFGLPIRDSEEILDHFDVSYVPNKNVDFFEKILYVAGPKQAIKL